MNAAASTNNAPGFDTRWLFELLALAALYFLAARLGLLLAIPGGHVTPVWPPSGIALAAVLLRGRRVWPGIWLGSFAANIGDFYGSPMSLATELGVAATFGIGASLAALWGGHLLRHFVGERNPLERVRDVSAFMALGGVVSCLVSATLGVSALCLGGFAPWSAYGQTWLTWWLGDTAGVFVVAPLFLVWRGARLPQSAVRWVELCGCFALLVAVTYYLFIENTTVLFTGKPLTFILIPFLVWPAIRFGERGAATAVGMIALLAVWGTIHQTGPFNVGSRNEALLLLEIFLSVVVLTALGMAAMVTERERSETAQQRAVEELESRVQERTASLIQTNQLLKAEIVERERARAALLSILEDQQQVEAALRESEERFSAYMQTMPLIAFMKDADGHLLYVNDAFERAFAMKLTDCQGKTDADLWPPETARQVRANDVKILAAGKPIAVEETVERPEGIQYWISYKFPFRDPRGRLYLAGTAINITDRKRAEAEITELLAREQAACQEAEVMRDANVALTQNLSVETVLETLLAHLGKLIPYDSANVMLRESETKFVVSELYGYESFQDVALTLDVGEHALLRQICTTGKSLLIGDTDEEPAWQKLPGAEHVRCWLGVPLIAYGKVIGLYSVDHAEPGVFTREHLRMAETLAAQAASAIQNAQLFEQEQRYAAELEQRIAERKRVDEELQASEEKYRTILERMEEGYAEVDLRGTYVFVNDSFCRITGRSRSELLGVNYKEIFDREQSRLLYETYHNVYLTGEPITGFEYVVTRKDGTKRLVEESVILKRDAEGRPIGFTGIRRDCTDRKRADEALRESEARYRELFERASDMIYTTDVSGIWRALNPAALRLLKYAEEELLGQSQFDLISPDYREPFEEFYRQQYVRKIPNTFHSFPVIAKDGTEIWLEQNSTLLFDNDRVAGFHFVARNITERKRAEELLKSFPRRLIEAQEGERKRIARELHDEIGQVLTAISLNLQAVRASSLTPTSRPKIDESILVVEDALRQVQNLALELRPSLLDDLGLAAAIRWFVGRFGQRTGIKTEIVTDAQIAEGRLSKELETACFRIVQEALTNVARHSQAKTVLIHLRTLSDETCISIKDDGIGFDASAGNGATPIRLGLRGMEERALAFGGRLEIKSAPSRGTEIRAHFPNQTKGN